MLYIMRHGRTDWNVSHKLQGRTDIPLNDEGRMMAAEAGKRYADIHFDICYSSPLARAKETAEIFMRGRNVPVRTDDRLVEMGFGVYEGIENSFVIDDCPINTLFKKPEEYVTVEGGESFEELFARTGEFIDNVVMPQVREGKDILIVGHGAMNCSIIAKFKNIPLKDFWDGMTDNCQVVKLI
ncbi:MAG: histidine phosphatase family protein [Eubacteriales bacterium]|nr:histidine phosphatase family protein [Eubacteriales bacterium]